MIIKNIFFDFDGVLAESVHVKTQAYHDLYIPYGQEIANKVVEHHRANGGMSRFEKFRIYHREFLDKEITDKMVDNLSKEYSKNVVNKVVNTDEVPGAEKFLKKYYRNYKFWIITGTPTAEIKEITERRGIDKYFIEQCGSPTKKWEWTEYLLDKYSLIKEETLFLGDAMSDYKAAKESKLHFALRDYEENHELFKNYDLVKFKDFFDLESKFEF